VCTKRLDLLVRTGKQSACTRRTDLVCDARMVAHTVVLCVQYACAQLFCVTSIVISCVV
jgi:hypothetical protein